MVSFTNLRGFNLELRRSHISASTDARVRPVKESETIFLHSTGNGMCFGFQFKSSTVWEARTTAKAWRYSVKQQEQNQEVKPA